MNNKLTYDKLPPEIQKRMLLEQEKQGNERNPNIFRENTSNGVIHGGFDWIETDDGYSFWAEVLKGDFNRFFLRYPKKEEELLELEKDTKTYPKVMEVSNSENFSNPKTRVVFMEKNGKYLAWLNASTLEEAEKTFIVAYWDYAREVAPTVNLTAEDISAGKGVGVDPKLIRFKESI